MATVDSERRLNLCFDDFDLDILAWLNSFGKRKRARIAKEAIRKAMIEARGSNQPSSPVLVQVSENALLPKSKTFSQFNETINLATHSSPKVHEQNVTENGLRLSRTDNILQDLVGIEDDSSIFSLI